MDFVTLATTTQSLMRHLQQQVPMAATSTSYVMPNQQPQQQHGLWTDSSDIPEATTTSHAPLLSKTAEAELYLLASNFLLYVAMVIIATMVAKIYFPESLERGRGLGEPTFTARSYVYQRASTSDPSMTTGRSASSSNDTIEDLEELLDSDEDNDRDDNGEDDEDNDDDDDVYNESSDDERKKITTKRKRNLSFLEDVEHANFTKAQVLGRLALCCFMLNVTFITWGVLQERMLTRRYPRMTGEFFTYSYFLVFTNRFWTLILSGALLLYLQPNFSRSTVLYEFSFPSISNMLSSWCQYEALRYVSFPATTLFKAFKLAPVMLMGKILGNKSYPQYDYLVAFLIGIGIAMFMTSSDDLKFGYDYLGEKASAKWTGVMLLFLFLLFDSFTSQFQSRMFQRHRDLSMVELMFATSAFSTILAGITLIHTKELYPALSFVYRHSEIHVHFLLFSICSTIGQLFIFYTIKNFGAVVFTLIMTARILLSIALSCILYGHQVKAIGFLGVMVVMGAVLYRIRRQAQGKQLLKWRGMEDDKAEELVQEWHQHLDM